MNIYKERAQVLNLAAEQKEREAGRHQRWLDDWAQVSRPERVAAHIKLVQQRKKQAKRLREEAYVSWRRHQELAV